MFNKIEQFLRTDIWKLNLPDLSKFKRMLIYVLRVIILALRGLRDHEISLRAAKLTFYSFLSTIALIGLIFGISKGFKLEKAIEQSLTSNFQGHPEVLDWLITFINSFLKNTSEKIIIIVSAIVLLVSVVKILSKIENASNLVWGVNKSRNWFRKFSDYLSITLISAVLIFLSTALLSYTASYMNDFSGSSHLNSFFIFLLKASPYVIIWFLLSLIYILIPNRKVSFTQAFLASIISGTVFAFAQWLFISLMIVISEYNPIYGILVSFPLFVIWLQISWVLILLGVEISFAAANSELFEFEYDIEHLNTISKKKTILLIVHYIVSNFEKNSKPTSEKEIKDDLEIPLLLIEEIISLLIDAKLLVKVKKNDNEEDYYQPAVDIKKITVCYVLDELDKMGVDKLLVKKSKESEQVEKVMAEILKTQKTQGNILLKDI